MFHDGVACALEDADHTPFASLPIFGASSRHIATDPRNNAVAVHRSPGIFCGYENIRLTGLL
jgi:hypothetical protein